MALAVPLRKTDFDGWEKVLMAGAALFGTGFGLAKFWPAWFKRAEHKDDLSAKLGETAFATLQGEISRLSLRVTHLEEQAQQREREHSSETAALRQELAEANGEKQRLTILCVQQAARIQDLEAVCAERKALIPEVVAAAREVAQVREGLE